MRLAYGNVIDDAAVSTTSTVATNSSITNIQSPIIGKKTIFNQSGDKNITFTFSELVTITCFAITNDNPQPSTIYTFNGVDYDTDDYYIFSDFGYGEGGYGEEGYGGVAYSFDPRTKIYYLDTPLVTTAVTLTIKNAPINYSVGRIFLGQYVEFEHKSRFGSSETFEDLSDVQSTLSGVLYYNVRDKVRKLSITPNVISHTQYYGVVKPLLDEVGIHGEVIADPFPATKSNQDSTIHGTIEQIPQASFLHPGFTEPGTYAIREAK